jgi:two-component system, OmpR family, sensor kinase
LRPRWRGRLTDLTRNRLVGASLRTRLVIASIVLLAVVCVVVGGLSMLLLRSYLLEQRDVQLAGAGQRSAAAYERELDNRDGDEDFDENAVPDFLDAPGQAVGTLSARIVDGQVLQAGLLDAEGDTRRITGAAAARLPTIPADGEPHTLDLERVGNYRLIAELRPDDVVLVTGLPLDELDGIVGRLAMIVGLVALGGLVLTGVASAVLVRLSLRPASSA